jgi:hypothetical protein
MLVTFVNLLRASLRCIQDLGVGYIPGQSKQQDGLFVFNAMLDSWAIDRLNIPAIVATTYPLTQGQKSYAIGPTAADWPGQRPNKIEDANLIILDSPSLPLRRAMKILTPQQYSLVKLQDVQSTIPEWLYYDYGYDAGDGGGSGNLPTGNGLVYIYPVPQNGCNQVELWTWQNLLQIANVSASWDMPPGYLEPVYLNLAVRLASQWGNQLRPDVLQLAKEAYGRMQAHNAPTPMMRPDGGSLSAEGSRNFGDFNYITGDLN